jgi:hypothetical protein
VIPAVATHLVHVVDDVIKILDYGIVLIEEVDYLA